MIFTIEAIVALLLCLSCTAFLLASEQRSDGLQGTYEEALLGDAVVVFYKSGASRDLAGAIRGGAVERTAFEEKIGKIAKAAGRCVRVQAEEDGFDFSSCGRIAGGKNNIMSAEIFIHSPDGAQRAIISTFG
jgi:hypothetical protein